jgi:colanic acid/amylovoran biosynthesis protein
MRVVIENGTYDLHNLGDIAMLQVAVRRLREHWPDAVIHVVTECPDQLRFHCPDTEPLINRGRVLWLQDRAIFGSAYRLLPRRISHILGDLERHIRTRYPRLAHPWITRRLRRRQIDPAPVDHFVDVIRQANLFVASGGGYITDSFSLHARMVLEIAKLALSLDIPVAMMGQGIGPITDASLLSAAESVFPHAHLIALRESRGAMALLGQLGVSNSRILVTGDDAVELAYEARPKEAGTAIGLNLRLASYASVTDDFAQRIRPILHSFAGQYGATLLGVPVSSHDEDGDHQSIQSLLGDYPDQDPGTDCRTPMELIRRIGRCRFIVTGSYHPAVFALAQGIPVIGLVRSAYYAGKFLGLTDQFGAGCDVLTLDSPDLEEKLRSAMARLLTPDPMLRQHLLDAAARQIALSRNAYAHLAKLLSTH